VEVPLPALLPGRSLELGCGACGAIIVVMFTSAAGAASPSCRWPSSCDTCCRPMTAQPDDKPVTNDQGPASLEREPGL
jgi:hypothetical protein